jgi:hypothetical protein
LDSFGAVDFIGYTCDGENEELTTVLLMSLTIFVENVGSVDFNITDFDFTFQDVTTDLLVGVSLKRT